MIYIKEYNIYNDIDDICNEYGIENYTINNGMVDVDGGVDLSNKSLDKLPLTFGIVTGYFFCHSNQLTSLKGSPKEVGGHFYCVFNKLTSLKGAPKVVGMDFTCGFNQLTSLEGSPIEVGGSFDCSHNKLKSLKGAPKVVGGDLNCSNNQLTSLNDDPKEVGGDLYCYNNNLPELFTKYISNKSYWKEILKWQNDYSIWRNDGSLDEYRFRELIKDIEDNDLY